MADAAQKQDTSADEREIKAVISRYLQAVKTWDPEGFRATFHPAANIAHYYVKGDEIKTISLDEFVKTIGALHEKYDNAEERATEIDVWIVNHIASVRVPFRFVMGPRTLEGQDLFNLAKCKGEWRIIHKSYYL